MEQKRLLLIKVITKLQWQRDLAEGILALMESADVDEATIDGLIKIIAQSIKQVKNFQQKTVLEKSLIQIHKIQEMETKDQAPQEELDHILNEIE